MRSIANPVEKTPHVIPPLWREGLLLFLLMEYQQREWVIRLHVVHYAPLEV